jgi:UDP-N-acetylmuramoyl-L-alanyl-D-glutamate--2,6-diaminopimelate ligase
MNTVKRPHFLIALSALIPAEFEAGLDVGCRSVSVSGMQLDSRKVSEGELFCALFGKNHDARD